MPETARHGIPAVRFARSAKGIIGNGDASRVWKGEIAQIAFAYGRLLFEAPIFYIQNPVNQAVAILI
jgi:hypothetical protein